MAKAKVSAGPKGPAKSGGGFSSRQHVKVKPVAGKDNRAVNPGAVAQLGAHVGKNPTPLMGGPGYKPNVSDGNYVAMTTECKAGGSRKIYPSGFQALTGKPVQAEVEKRPDPSSTGKPAQSFTDTKSKWGQRP
jgi:hypothetical protein